MKSFTLDIATRTISTFWPVRGPKATSMREANDRGYECLIVEDATASYFPEFKRVALAMITAQGGIVGCCAAAPELLEALPDGG